MKRKVLSLTLAAAMCAGMLTACGSSAATEEEAPVTEEGAAVEADADTEAESVDVAEEAAIPDELTTIELYSIDFQGGAELEEVSAKVNEITEAEANVHVNLNLLDFGSYLQQISLMLSGNERADVCLITPVPPTTFGTMTSQNQLMDLSDIIPEYAPDAYAAMGKYWAGVTVNDGIYAFPIECGMATDGMIAMRKDVLDELGLTEKAENIKTWSEFAEILDAVQAAQDTLPEELQTSCMVCNSNQGGSVFPTGLLDFGTDEFAGNFCIDNLADNNGIIEVDPETQQIIPYYSTEGYYSMLERVTDWNQKGYVFKDAMTDENGGDVLMKDGITFSYLSTGQINFEQTKEKTVGRDLVVVDFVKEPMGTQVCQTWGLGVPVSAEEPEAACAFLNLLYKNSDLVNLLVYGIEGRDYELNEAGEACPIENAPYSSQNFIWGNSLLGYPAEGMGSDVNERILAEDENRELFPDFGFVPNTEPIANELTAIHNVIVQYRPTLESGNAKDLKAMYDEYVAAMEAAGINDVIAELQRQLDEFRASK